MNAIYDSELYHHGVKGMKWGVRHLRESVGNGGRAVRKKATSIRSGVSNKISRSKTSSRSSDSQVREQRKQTAIKVGKIAAVAAVAAVGTYAITSRKANQYKSMAKRAVQIADDRNSMAKRAVTIASRERSAHKSDIKDAYNVIKGGKRMGARGRQKRANDYLRLVNLKGKNNGMGF